MRAGKHPLSSWNPSDTLNEMSFDRITINPAQMNGQPCVRGMRLTVQRVVKLVAEYLDRDELRKDFPDLEDEDIRQALAFAAESMDDEILSWSAPNEVAA